MAASAKHRRRDEHAPRALGARRARVARPRCRGRTRLRCELPRTDSRDGRTRALAAPSRARGRELRRRAVRRALLVPARAPSRRRPRAAACARDTRAAPPDRARADRFWIRRRRRAGATLVRRGGLEGGADLRRLPPPRRRSRSMLFALRRSTGRERSKLRLASDASVRPPFSIRSASLASCSRSSTLHTKPTTRASRSRRSAMTRSPNGRRWSRWAGSGRAATTRARASSSSARERRPQASKSALVQAESANAMGSWLLNIGRDAEAVAMHASVLPLLDAESHARARAQTLDRLGMSNGLAGRLAACVEAYDRAAELWRRLDNPRALASQLAGARRLRIALARGDRAVVGTIVVRLPRGRDGVGPARRARARAVGGSVRAHGPRLRARRARRDRAGAGRGRRLPCDCKERRARRVGGLAGASSARSRCSGSSPQRKRERRSASSLPDAERTGSAWWSCNTRAYLALACVQCHDVAGAEEALEGRPPPLGSAAERRLEWARAELALLRRDGPAARAIVDALLAAHPGDARAPIPQLYLVRGAALVLERRYGSAVQMLQRARDAVLASGGLGLTLRIHAALATALGIAGPQRTKPSVRRRA